MAKKNTKHRKINIEKHEHNKKNLVEHRWSGRISITWSTSSTCRVTLRRQEHHVIWKSRCTLAYERQHNCRKTRDKQLSTCNLEHCDLFVSNSGSKNMIALCIIAIFYILFPAVNRSFSIVKKEIRCHTDYLNKLLW